MRFHQVLRFSTRYFQEYFPKNRVKTEINLADVIPEYNSQKLKIDRMSYSQIQNQMDSWGKKNSVKKCFYGLGYYPSHTPGVLKNNFLENPNFIAHIFLTKQKSHKADRSYNSIINA